MARARQEEQVVRDGAPLAQLAAAAAPALSAPPNGAPPPRPRRRRPSLLASWDGWPALPDEADPRLDRDGYIHLDGRGLSFEHYWATERVASVLRAYFEDRPDVTVAGELFMHFRQGDPRGFLKPDVAVTFGHGPGRSLMSHKTWERGVPVAVVEVLSDSTHSRDVGMKKDLYEDLGVAEYLLLDPHGRHLHGPVQMWRLVRGFYEEVPLRDGQRVQSVMGVTLQARDGMLRLYDTETGEELLDLSGEAKKRRAETARADAEKSRADAAEKRLAELERRLGNL